MEQRETVFLALFIICAIWGATMTGLYLTEPEAQREEYSPDTITIGSVQPLSGAAAETGSLLQRGFRFGVNYVNDHGGIENLGGAELAVKWGDHQSGDPSVAKSEANRLITEENVFCVEGCWHSSATKTASAAAENHDVPFICPESTSPALTERGYDWYYRLNAHDGTFTRLDVEAIKTWNETSDETLNTVSIIYEDSEWGYHEYTGWKNNSEKYGFTVEQELSYTAGEVSDLSSQVTKLKNAGSDVVFVAAYTRESIMLVNAMDDANWFPKVMLAGWCGFLNSQYIQEVGDLHDHIMSRTPFSQDIIQPGTALGAMNQAFKAEHGKNISLIGIGAIQAALTIDWALEKATVQPVYSQQDLRARFKTALDTMNWDKNNPNLVAPYQGMNFDEHNQNVEAGGLIVQMMPNTDQYRTVSPMAYKTKDPIINPEWPGES